MLFTDQANSFTPFSPQTSSAAPTVKPTFRSPRPLVGQSKICTKCRHSQDLSEFAIKRGARAACCRTCQKAISDAHYQQNRELTLAATKDRNEAVRDALRITRDSYLADCLCEKCSSTVDLQITTREGYEGFSVHEVIAGAHGVARMEEALANSKVLCRPCMGNKYGKLGAYAKSGRDIGSKKR